MLRAKVIKVTPKWATLDTFALVERTPTNGYHTAQFTGDLWAKETPQMIAEYNLQQKREQARFALISVRVHRLNWQEVDQLITALKPFVK